MLPAWVYILTATAAGTAYSFKGLYKTASALRQITDSSNSTPALVALSGRVYASSVGGLTAWKIGIVGGVLVAVMSILIVVRHTRAEEETGRLELVGAGAVGRSAALTAALGVAFGASLVLGLVVSAGLMAVGQPVPGSVAFGLSWVAVGWVFAAVAAVTAQLSESARTAKGIAIAVLGASYLLRAAGDAAGSGGARWLTWLSPLGWAEQVRAFGSERWWVLGLAVVLAAVIAGGGYGLAANRDLGTGLVADRPGPATGSPMLRSALALSWRLQRGSLLAWASGFAVAGLAVGSISPSVGNLIKGNKSMIALVQRMGGRGAIDDAYLAVIMGIFGLVAAVYATSAALRLRSEETESQADLVLAASVGRVRWAGGHLVLVVAGTAVILAAGGLGAGLAYGVGTHDLSAQLPRVLGAALVQLPAALVVAGIAILLFGLVPGLVPASWAAVVACVVIGQIGWGLKLSQRILDISPFTHVPKLPGGTFSATPLLWLTVAALALAAVGLAGFRQRDLG
jgi:ABC-2 type transport system permease protein